MWDQGRIVLIRGGLICRGICSVPTLPDEQRVCFQVFVLILCFDIGGWTYIRRNGLVFPWHPGQTTNLSLFHITMVELAQIINFQAAARFASH